MILKLEIQTGFYQPQSGIESFNLAAPIEIVDYDKLNEYAKKDIDKVGYHKRIRGLHRMYYCIDMDQVDNIRIINFRGRTDKIMNYIEQYFLGKVLEKMV